jgi:hypothetical protein
MSRRRWSPRHDLTPLVDEVAAPCHRSGCTSSRHLPEASSTSRKALQKFSRAPATKPSYALYNWQAARRQTKVDLTPLVDDSAAPCHHSGCIRPHPVRGQGGQALKHFRHCQGLRQRNPSNELKLHNWVRPTVTNLPHRATVRCPR